MTIARQKTLHFIQPRPTKNSVSACQLVVAYESSVKFGGFSAGYDWRIVCLHFPLLHCVLAVTLASPPLPDSSGFTLFCYLLPSFFLLTPSSSVSLTFQCNPLLLVKSLIGARQCSIQLSANTLIVGPLCKNVNMMRTLSKNVHIRHRDARKTK